MFGLASLGQSNPLNGLLGGSAATQAGLPQSILTGALPAAAQGFSGNGIRECRLRMQFLRWLCCSLALELANERSRSPSAS